jgi:hypothetical protein
MSAAASFHNPSVTLRPGEMALVTGIYRVTHREHRSEHDSIVICGEELPLCRTCKDAVRYTLQRQVCHITHDFDFAGPNLKIVGE